MLLEFFLRDMETLDDLVRRDHGLICFAAGGEEIREEGLQNGEALRDDGAGRTFAGGFDMRRRGRGGQFRRSFLVPVAHRAECLSNFTPERIRLERDRAPVLTKDPRGKLRQRGVTREEDAVLEFACIAESALDPPGGVTRELDSRLALDVADLPRRPSAELVDVEVGRNPEVPLPAGGEFDVASDARDAEGPDVLAVEVLADHVPAPVVREQAVRVDGALALAVTRDRVVRELDRALLRDRPLELPEPSG